MLQTRTPDRQELLIWAMLSIVGAILAVIGWVRWAGCTGRASSTWSLVPPT